MKDTLCVRLLNALSTADHVICRVDVPEQRECYGALAVKLARSPWPLRTYRYAPSVVNAKRVRVLMFNVLKRVLDSMLGFRSKQSYCFFLYSFIHD